MISKRMGFLSVLWSGLKLNLLQAAWNFERLQNIGFLFSIINVLKRTYKGDKEAFLRAINRHVSFFNTNIFFAPAVLGVIARLEEELDDKNPEQKEREIENTKIGIMGPLAAIGDSLFYFGIKPLAMLAGGGIAVLSGYTMEGLIWATAVSLAVFNIPKIFIKYYLLIKAYYNYKELFVLIQKVRFQDIMKSIKIIGIGLSGGIFAAYLAKKEPALTPYSAFDALILVVSFFVFVRLLRGKTPVSRILTGLIVVCGIAAYIK